MPKTSSLLNTFSGGATPLLRSLPAGSWGALGVPDLGASAKALVGQLGGALGGAFIGGQLQQLGIDLEQDVFGWIGDVALFVRGDSVEAIRGGAVIEVTDRDRAAQAIPKLIGLARQQGEIPFEPTRVPGAELAFAATQPGMARRGGRRARRRPRRDRLRQGGRGRRARSPTRRSSRTAPTAAPRTPPAGWIRRWCSTRRRSWNSVAGGTATEEEFAEAKPLPRDARPDRRRQRGGRRPGPRSASCSSCAEQRPGASAAATSSITPGRAAARRRAGSSARRAPPPRSRARADAVRASAASAPSASAGGAPSRSARSSAATSAATPGSGARSRSSASASRARAPERRLGRPRGPARRRAGPDGGGRPRPAPAPAAGPA